MAFSTSLPPPPPPLTRRVAAFSRLRAFSGGVRGRRRSHDWLAKDCLNGRHVDVVWGSRI